MKDSTRRALRTLAHGIAAGLIAIPVMAAALPTPDGRIASIVATVVAICAALTKVVNALEDAGAIPAFFKAPASDGADPVPADSGYVDAAIAVIILLVLLAIFGGALLSHWLFLLFVIVLLLLFVGR